MPFEHQDVKKIKCICRLLRVAGDLNSDDVTTSYAYDLASNTKSVRRLPTTARITLTDDGLVDYLICWFARSASRMVWGGEEEAAKNSA